MRFRPLCLPRSLPALFACGLAVTFGCAGAGSSTGKAGSSGSGTAGTSGSAGTTGSAGTSGGAGTSGNAGTTGSAGSTSPGAGGVAGTTSGAAGTGGSSSSGSSGTTGAGGITSGAAGTTGSGGGGTGGICQMATLEYVPKIPTVYLVVDRSGSMFHCLTVNQNVCPTKTDTAWSQLNTAIQTVVTQLQSQVRFGYTTVFGTTPSAGGSCVVATAGTLTDNVVPKLDNATDIKAKYDSLAWPLEAESSTPGKKFESPASYAITAATKALTDFTMPGDKYIIFITDGQEDYCDDALEICASDSTVGALQAAYAANIRTIVFGLQTLQFNLPTGVLDAFANAGAGEPTVASLMNSTDTTAIFDQCQGVMPWRTDLTASGHPTTRGATAVVGTYATTAGPTKPFKPNAADQNMLVTQLSTALAGVKSCTFDLNDVSGKAIKVDTMKLAQAHVKIQGVEVPLDPGTGNGWTVLASAPTQLVFNGTTCTTWRNPASTKIDLQFPCGTIIFE